jgi:hypothetical protein
MGSFGSQFDSLRARRKPADAPVLTLGGDDALVTTAEAARMCGLTPHTMRQKRCDRTGPRCFRLGDKQQSRVVYRLSDVQEWLGANARAVYAN